MRRLKHNAFERVTEVAVLQPVNIHRMICDWCGQTRTAKKDRTKPLGLFRFGTIADDNPRGTIHYKAGHFCSTKCCSSYHSK